tara:strand:+ start:3314 stop:3991 length:678 start_codon:yes stop_codon:yes gene_type:complete
MILVFDLDDTLYPEITYVKSGFMAVSIFLKKNFKLNQDLVYSKMLDLLKKDGRGNIFDEVLRTYSIYTVKNLKKCISTYRSHVPHINLHKDAERCISRFKEYKKYIVTDGNILVQRKKISALDLTKNFEKIFTTYQYGISYSKPSTKCFKMILKKEKINPWDMVYVGDNPHKDFINLKKIGIHTIRIQRGCFKDTVLDSNHEAEYTFKNLDCVTKKMIRKLNENR